MAAAATMAQPWPYADALRAVQLAEQGSDGFYRSWVMLLPEGEYEHPKFGNIDLSKRVLSELAQHFDAGVRGIEIALDYDHKAAEGDSKAPGWLECVEYRAASAHAPAGLWGLVRWTRLGFDDVQAQIYRYISAEFKPDYTDDMSGKEYKNVLIGVTLTNRPFMKNMPAIHLSERALSDVAVALSDGNTSTRAWSSVNKSSLPDSCFLDPKNRRLPIYEGAGPMVNGKYTKRGKLNLNAVKSALAAVHGARSGKPMSGLPAGTAAKLQRLMDRYYGSGDKQSGGSSSAAASEGDWGSGGMGNNLTLEDLEDGLADEGRTTVRLSALKSNARGSKTGSTSGRGGAIKDDDPDNADSTESADAYDDDDSGDLMDDDDSGDGYDDDSSDDSAAMDDDTSDSSDTGNTMGRKGGKAGRAKFSNGRKLSARRMSGRKMSEGGDEPRTLAEYKLRDRELTTRLIEVERDLYREKVAKWLNGWDAGSFQFVESKTKSPDGEGAVLYDRAVRVTLSRPARTAVEKYLLSERCFQMAERDRSEILKLFEVIAAGTVDLSVRGSSRDTDAPERQGGQQSTRGLASDDVLFRVAERVATEKGLVFSELRDKNARGDRKAAEQISEIYSLAARRMDYQGVQ